MAQEFDLVMKALAERYPAHFVQLVRGGVRIEKVERAEKEAVAVKRDSDVLFAVTEDGYEYIMLIEAQTRVEPGDAPALAGVHRYAAPGI